MVPHDLFVPEGMVVPQTQKQAAVIEKTASFIAGQGIQMEIVLRTRQSGNKQFDFLNPDNSLNPFYRELTRLIKIGMYVPDLRRAAAISAYMLDDASRVDSPVSQSILKLPKVDISGTSYASLINKIRPPKPSPSPDLVVTTTDLSETDQSPPANAVVDEWTRKYQEYYTHYYQFYYTQYSVLPQNTQEQAIEKAANDAAHAAQALLTAQRKAQETNTELLTAGLSKDQILVIDKTAEYVARNGSEFEGALYSSKGSQPSFSFLRPTDPAHAYYLAKRRHFQANDDGDSVKTQTLEQALEDCTKPGSDLERQEDSSPPGIFNLVPHYSDSEEEQVDEERNQKEEEAKEEKPKEQESPEKMDIQEGNDSPKREAASSKKEEKSPHSGASGDLQSTSSRGHNHHHSSHSSHQHGRNQSVSKTPISMTVKSRSSSSKNKTINGAVGGLMSASHRYTKNSHSPVRSSSSDRHDKAKKHRSSKRKKRERSCSSDRDRHTKKRHKKKSHRKSSSPRSPALNKTGSNRRSKRDRREDESEEHERLRRERRARVSQFLTKLKTTECEESSLDNVPATVPAAVAALMKNNTQLNQLVTGSTLKKPHAYHRNHHRNNNNSSSKDSPRRITTAKQLNFDSDDSLESYAQSSSLKT